MTDFSNNKAPTRSKWWLAYAVFIVFIELLGYSVLLRHPDAGVLEFLSVCLSVGLYAGLFGFALSKSIMTPVFWHAFLLVNIVYAHIYAYFGAIDLYYRCARSPKNGWLYFLSCMLFTRNCCFMFIREKVRPSLAAKQ